MNIAGTHLIVTDKFTIYCQLMRWYRQTEKEFPITVLCYMSCTNNVHRVKLIGGMHVVAI